MGQMLFFNDPHHAKMIYRHKDLEPLAPTSPQA